jgi:hypothetical protein
MAKKIGVLRHIAHQSSAGFARAIVPLSGPLANLAPNLLRRPGGMSESQRVKAMCEIIDFQSRRRALSRAGAAKPAENSSRAMAQVAWLRPEAAPGAGAGAGACREIGQGLIKDAPDNRPS